MFRGSLVTLIGAILVSIGLNHDASAQPSSIDDPGTLVTATSASGIPSTGALSTYINSQAPIITAAYCVQSSTALWIFDLANSPLVGDEVEGGNPGLGLATWRTYHYWMYGLVHRRA